MKRTIAWLAALMAFGIFPTPNLPAGPLEYPQPKSAPDELFAVIEIPEGSINKYEIEPTSGALVLSRVVSMPVVYPINYGAFPQSLAGDGDPLDALVFSRQPIHPGALVLVRPVGVLRMQDGGKEDHKVLCVPTSSVDPTYSHIGSLQDIPTLDQQRIEAFFRIYKDLPENRKKVELSGFGDSDEARKIIQEALARYAQKN